MVKFLKTRSPQRLDVSSFFSHNNSFSFSLYVLHTYFFSTLSTYNKGLNFNSHDYFLSQPNAKGWHGPLRPATDPLKPVSLRNQPRRRTWDLASSVLARVTTMAYSAFKKYTQNQPHTKTNAYVNVQK